MPVHDWTRVEAGIFHALHVAWIPEIARALNKGILPEGYYALPEQHTGKLVPDVLALHAGQPPVVTTHPEIQGGGTAVAVAPPRVRHRQTVELKGPAHPRFLAVRHVSGNQLVAIVEIVSPSNKDRPKHVESFAEKAVAALEAGIHVLMIDLFPPGPSDPHGMHTAIYQMMDPFSQSSAEDDPPKDEPVTLAAYSAGKQIEIYLEHVAVGAKLPDMPLFLQSDRYVDVPLEKTYELAFEMMPKIYASVLER